MRFDVLEGTPVGGPGGQAGRGAREKTLGRPSNFAADLSDMSIQLRAGSAQPIADEIRTYSKTYCE